MSVDYYIHRVDWDAYAAFISASPSLTDAELWDAEDEFQLNHIHPNSSIISSHPWANIKYGPSSFEVYSNARSRLQSGLRSKFDLLFSTVNDHSRLYGKWIPEFTRVIDCSFETVPDALIAALNPTSVNRLNDLSDSLDMDALAEAVSKSADFESFDNHFTGVDAYIEYVSSWGVLLQESKKGGHGVVIGTAI